MIDYRTQSPVVAERFRKLQQRPVVLEVERLSREFQTNGTTCTALRDVSFRVHRREFLHQIDGGFTSLALAGMMSRDGAFASDLAYDNPLAPKQPQLPAKAKSVIFLFMYGGPSHMDTFDYKPKMYPLDGKTIPIKTFGRGGKKNEGRVVGPKWQFRQYGESGKWVSELFPNIGGCVDDIAFIHSMTADSPIHGSAMLM